MPDFITTIYQQILNIINAIGTNLDELVNRLDATQFGSVSGLSQDLGTIRYIIGDPLYLLFGTLIMIGVGFTLWKLIKIVISAISGFIPFLKGRINIE